MAPCGLSGHSFALSLQKQAKCLAEQARLLSLAALRCKRGSLLLRSKQHKVQRGHPKWHVFMKRRRARKLKMKVRYDASASGFVCSDTAAGDCDVVIEQLMCEGVSSDFLDAPKTERVREAASSSSCAPCSRSWMKPEEFFTFAQNAGLRSHDIAWMEDFDRLCEESWSLDSPDSLDDRVSSSVLVTIVMDDLVRHCQQTQDSLLEMLKVLQVSGHSDLSGDTSSCRQSRELERLLKPPVKEHVASGRKHSMPGELPKACSDKLSAWVEEPIIEVADHGSRASSSVTAWPVKKADELVKERKPSKMGVLMKELWTLLPTQNSNVADRL